MRISGSFLMALLSLPLALMGASAQQVVEKVTPKTPSNQTGYRILHTFLTATDGHNPVAGVILDPMGNLYGTTYTGSIYGCGAVFELHSSTGFQVLYDFTTNRTDGCNPYAGLVFGTKATLYGITYGGGTFGKGAVFELIP